MTPPFHWKPLAGRTLEAALNRALALDPETRDGLRALQGQRIVLQIEQPPLAMQVRVEGERLVVGPVDKADEPDLSVRSTLGALLAQLPMFRRDDAPPVGRLHVSGDAELARRLNGSPSVSIRIGSNRSRRCSATCSACRSPTPWPA